MYPNLLKQNRNPPRSVRFNVVFSLVIDNFVQVDKDSLQNLTLYPVNMSYVIWGGVQLIDSHLMDALQVEFSCGASVNKKKQVYNCQKLLYSLIVKCFIFHIQ